MNELNVALDRLDQHVQSLSKATSAPEAFQVLLQALPLIGPRACIYLIRKGAAKGWNNWGFPDDAAAAQRAHEFPLTAELTQRFADGELRVSEPSSGDEPDFGQALASERADIALRIQGRPVAWIVAERQTDEEPWSPRVLSILQMIAELQLDVALMRKRGADAPAAATATARRSVDAPMSAAVEPPIAPPIAPPMIDEEAAGVAESNSGGPQVEAARRFARLVATDIRLYNEDAVNEGRKNGDLVQRLNEHLNRGRETFMQRHGTLGPAGLDILHDAFVQVLAGGDAALIPHSSLEA